MSSEDLQSKFETACKVLPSLATSLSSEQLLLFYALFKQAKLGDCSPPRPSFLQFEARRKWDSWHALAGVANEEAMRHYIEGVTKFAPNWEEAGAFDGLEASWVRVSRMAPPKPERIAEDEQSSFFNAIRNQDLETLKKIISEANDLKNLKKQIPVDGGLVKGRDSEVVRSSPDAKNVDEQESDENSPRNGLVNARDAEQVDERESDENSPCNGLVNARDAEDMTGLHWAADGGSADIIKHLLSAGAEIDARDASGQTALFYAASCGHVSCVQELLARGADRSLKDGEGLTAAEVADPDCGGLLL